MAGTATPTWIPLAAAVGSSLTWPKLTSYPDEREMKESWSQRHHVATC
jgi:hypothetical protein